MTKDILVIGGGFAGFWAALAARRVAGNRAQVRLISPEPVLQMRPRLYEAAPETLGVALLPLLERTGIEFVEGEAAGLDVDGTAVALSSGAGLHYDRLVVATGSKLRRPDIPGAGDAFTVDTQQEAITFDRRLAELARTVADPHVAVVGAGFTGIELALELRDRMAEHGSSGLSDRLHILLIDQAPVVGAELGPGPRPAIETALDEARVEVRLKARLSAIADDRITFDDGHTVTAHAVVLATGMAAAPFAAAVPGARDRLGRVMVDKFLRAPAARNVFVTGDAAAAETGDGHHALQSCQHALQLGRFAGENAARELLGKPLVPYAQPRYVTCLDLGRSGAVLTEGWERVVRQTGAEAKALKQYINRKLIYPRVDVSVDELLGLSSLDPAAQTGSR